MKKIYMKNLRLKPSILTLFIFLTVPVFFTIVLATYFSNEKMARSNADDLVERFRTDAVENIQSVFDPIKSLIRSAATLGTEYPDLYLDNRCLKYFYSMLLHSDKIVSIYVGLEDGSFRQARRVEPAVQIQDKLPPEGARFAYRWIDPAKETPPVDHYDFLDAKGMPLGASAQTTNYDPRTRGWYRNTAVAGAISITDPDVFAALGLIGFTVAAPFYTNGKVAGVAAADITLDGLSEYLSERKISPGTLSYILDTQGGVLANSELAKTYTDEDGQL